jgi:hypothetical protein
MAIITPTVEPSVGSEGNSVSTEPKILFDKAIDLGSVNSSNFFIVSIKKLGTASVDDFMETSNSIEDLVDSTIAYRRVNLLDTNEYTGEDDGTSGTPGELYRSEVVLSPKKPLNPNTDYAVIVSNKVSALSVFDAQINAQTGTGGLLTAGVYEGLSSDTYVVQITQAGDSNTAYYTWMRTSDAFMSDPIQARARHIEIDKGVKVKFEAGDYQVGDTFEINVRPEDNISEIYNWTFSTGLGDYELPEDQNSGEILDLSVNNGNGGNGDIHHFYVESIEPELGDTLVKIANKGIAIVQNVVIQTKEDTADYNGTKIELTSGGTAGSEVVTYTPALIQVSIEEDVSTSNDVIEALNNDAGFSADLTAYLGIESIKVSAQTVRIKKGVSPNTIVITFNRDVDETTIDGNIRITKASIYPFDTEEDLFFSSSVAGKVVTLTIEE